MNRIEFESALGRRCVTRSSRNRRLRPTVLALEAREMLSTLTVSSTADDGSAGTLRAAIAQANSDGGGDTIIFSSLFDTPQRITLTGGQLELTGTTAGTTITGPGAGLLSVSGDNASRVFLVDANVSASISGLTVSGGNAGQNGSGGGLYNRGGTLTLTACTVSGNSAGGLGGGGLCNLNGVATLNACTVSGNSSPYGGGGLENFTGMATAAMMNLTSCTVSGNSSQYGGGGLENFLGTATLTNCTVSGNSVGGRYPGGNGVFNHDGSTATLTNTIVAGNSPAGGDIFGSYLGSNDLIGVDPLLAPLGDYGGPTPTMPPLPGSPAIGKGIRADYPGTSTPITTDQRGLPLASLALDIGAFQTNPLVVNTARDGTGSPSGDLSLRQAVNLADLLGGAAITFDPTVFATPRTITLTRGQLDLTGTTAGTTITGPGANLLSVSGHGASRVFLVDANVSASISGLTITGGNTGLNTGRQGEGGGLDNAWARCP